MKNYRHPRYPEWMIRALGWAIVVGLVLALVREGCAAPVVPCRGEGTHGACADNNM